MTAIPPRASAFLPTPRQELLLRAAVLADGRAREAWERWSSGQPEPLDAGSERLLPLVYRNLARSGVDVPQLRAHYRRTWATNALLLRAVAPLLRRLRQAGIPTMLLKGAALTLVAYRDQGVRPMDDVDVLVPRAQAADALRLALAGGWTPDRPLPSRFTHGYLSACAEELFRDRAGASLDLHWHMFLDSANGAEADAEVWHSAAAAIVDDDAATTTPGRAELLFHVFVHGARWSPTPPIRWVADALALMEQTPPAVDWSRFVRQATLRGLALPVLDSLDYLVDAFEAPVPAAVLAELRARRPSTLERAEYRLWLRGAPALGVRGMALLYARRYARFSEGLRPWPRLLGIAGYLRQLWRVERPGSLAWTAVNKSRRRLRSARVR